jgi:hypothetical protein
MAATFIAILTAHLLGYLLFQAGWLIHRQPRIWPLVLHSGLVTSMSGLLLGSLHWQALLAIFLTHVLMDAIKAYFPAKPFTALPAGLFITLALLLGLACVFPAAANSGWWIAGLAPEVSGRYFAALTIVSGIVLCVPVGGNLIAALVSRFADELRDNEIAGLKRGGHYIGWLERFLVLLLLLMDQPNGIGFLIAAKSILRFGEIKDPSQRKVAEYIIIGTFLSFGWALLISALTQKALKHWMP